MSVVMSVPSDVAEDLFAHDLAARALKSRGEPAAISAVIEVVGVAANLVTIVVAVPEVREVLQRGLGWALRRSPRTCDNETSVIRVRVANGTEKILSSSSTDEELRQII